MDFINPHVCNLYSPKPNTVYLPIMAFQIFEPNFYNQRRENQNSDLLYVIDRVCLAKWFIH